MFLFLFFFVVIFLFFILKSLVCFVWFWFYGVALHLNSISGSSDSASESVVQSFDEESVVQSDNKLTDEFSNKRLDTLESVDGSDVVGKGDAGKYGVETMLTVSSPFVSRMGER